MVDRENVCFRHTSKPASVGCQRCERPICTSCMTQASVGFQCPECLKRQGQQVRTAGQLGQRPTPTLTIGLIAASAAMFVVQFMVGGRDFRGGIVEDLIMFGPSIADGQIWQILTSGFLHADPVHIGFNMLLLWMIGGGVEHQIGKVRYALIYFSSLFAGGAFDLAFNIDVGGLGASGAVLGMFGGVAGLMVLKGRSIREVPGFEIIILNLFIPLIVPGVSFWAHFGGIVGGFLMGAMFVQLGVKSKLSDQAVFAVGALLTVGWFVAAVWLASIGGL